MIYIYILMALPALAAPAPKPSQASAEATLQMLNDIQSTLRIISQAATQCYDVKVANPTGKSYLLSDSLVKDLACAQLNPATVFRSLQTDAFTPERHWPVMNWPSNGIANCWALALAQRQAFYLTRFNSKNPTDGLVEKLLGMAGGNMPGAAVNIPDSNLREETARAVFNHGFRSQIEKRQHDLFYSAGNLGFIMGSRARGEGDNRESLATIASDLAKGRMPALILRAAITAQHVILVKKIKKTGPDSYRLTVYDSNQPHAEPTIDFTDGQFYAPNVVELFHRDGGSPVGVFVTHEEEMDRIQDVVFSHYSDLCKKVKALEKEVN